MELLLVPPVTSPSNLVSQVATKDIPNNRADIRHNNDSSLTASNLGNLASNRLSKVMASNLVNMVSSLMGSSLAKEARMVLNLANFLSNRSNLNNLSKATANKLETHMAPKAASSNLDMALLSLRVPLQLVV
jgi:hypothetical protein